MIKKDDGPSIVFPQECLSRWVFYEETRRQEKSEREKIFLVAIKGLLPVEQDKDLRRERDLILPESRRKILYNGKNETRPGKLVIERNQVKQRAFEINSSLFLDRNNPPWFSYFDYLKFVTPETVRR